MPCALPPVDQAASQLGWGHGTFLGPGVSPVWHNGLDFMADTGSPVIVPWAGTVVDVGYEPFGGSATLGMRRDALGHYVTISHGTIDPRNYPVFTRYANLRDAPRLTVGQNVSQGDLIGYVGTSGLAPENRDRPRMFFQTFTRRDAPGVRTPGADPLERFFTPLGVARDGAATPGPVVTPFDHTPTWGGRLLQNDSCATSTAGLRGLDPRRQQSKYARYGHTQLTSSRPYLPADYAETGSGAAAGGAGALLIGGAIGLAWWIFGRRG